MRADNSQHLAIAAQRRHELTRAKAIRALRELDTAGAPVTFQAVADTAEVSRSWLYAQHDIRAEINRLRNLDRQPLPSPAPTSQRGTDASLSQRLAIALARNRDLTEDNHRLRRQLAHALGRLRAAGLPVVDEPPDPRTRFGDDRSLPSTAPQHTLRHLNDIVPNEAVQATDSTK